MSTFADGASALTALRAGARGYLTKDASAEQIHAGVLAVTSGAGALDPAVQRHIVAALNDEPRYPRPGLTRSCQSGLMPREAQLFELVSCGRTDAEIAERRASMYAYTHTDSPLPAAPRHA